MSQDATSVQTVIPPRMPVPLLDTGRRLVGFLDDYINPIVVKELRQAVRSRFIMMVINLFLIVQLGVVTIFLFNTTPNGKYSMGRDVFMTLHMLLLCAGVFFVPAYVAVRFAAERSAQNVDLLFSTTISPFSIIWGKFLSGVVVTVLLFSTAAPFMVLTYLLRGIDVPTILLILGMDFLAVLGAIQFAILLMSGSNTLFARCSMLLLCLFTFGYVLVHMGVSTWEFAYRGMGRDGAFWYVVVGVVLLAVAYHVGLMYASAAIISPPSSNRALPLRVFMALVWLLSGVITLITSMLTADRDWFVGWAVISASIMIVVMLVAICERDHWGPRVLATVPQRWWLRPIAFLFYSGSAGGVMYSLLIMVLSLLSVILFHLPTVMLLQVEIAPILNLCCYTVIYALAGVFVVRYLGRGKIKSEATAAVSLGLMVLGCMGPVMLMFFLAPEDQWDRSVIWHLGNPFAAYTANQDNSGIYVTVSLITAGVMLALSVPWIRSQFRIFRRPALPEPSQPSTPSQMDAAQKVEP